MAKTSRIARAKATERSRSRAEARQVPPPHPDAPLIKSCIDYARALRGMSGAFEVDPTGDCNFAQAIDTVALRQAEKASHFAANYLPSTFDGLRAKASTALIGLDLDRDSTSKVLRSLCDDIERFHKMMTASDRSLTTREIAP